MAEKETSSETIKVETPSGEQLTVQVPKRKVLWIEQIPFLAVLGAAVSVGVIVTQIQFLRNDLDRAVTESRSAVAESREERKMMDFRLKAVENWQMLHPTEHKTALESCLRRGNGNGSSKMKGE